MHPSSHTSKNLLRPIPTPKFPHINTNLSVLINNNSDKTKLNSFFLCDLKQEMTFTKMRRDHGTLKAVLGSDLNELGIAAKNLANHTFKLTGLGFGTSILEWIASIAAIYLLVLDRTNWKTNMLTSLLIPYIFFSLPSLIFGIFRGEIGKWIAFVAVIIQLFFPKHTREYLELPVALVILAVVAPELIAGTFRDSWVGLVICLCIGCYLLQEHIRASGGFREAFTKANGISNTVGIIALVVFPVWGLIF